MSLLEHRVQAIKKTTSFAEVVLHNDEFDVVAGTEGEVVVSCGVLAGRQSVKPPVLSPPRSAAGCNM